MIRIIFENKQVLNEIKMEQVLPRFKSKAFKLKCEEVMRNAVKNFVKFVSDEKSIRMGMTKEEIAEDAIDAKHGAARIEESIKDSIPHDISLPNQAEALNWLISVFLSSVVDDRDVVFYVKLNRPLETFYQIKEQGIGRILAKQDIYSIKTTDELFKVVDDATPAYEEYKQKRAEKDAAAGTNKIYEDDNWEVFIPENKGAAVKLGKGTKWCTAAPGLQYYEKYHSKERPLIIFISKTDPEEKYQFHYDEGDSQFKDKNDDDMEESPLFFRLNEIVKHLPDKLPKNTIDETAEYKYINLGNGREYKEVRGEKSWTLNGRLDRRDGPAEILCNGIEVWYQNGEVHRTDGPAIVYTKLFTDLYGDRSSYPGFYLYGIRYPTKTRWEEAKEERGMTESIGRKGRSIRIIYRRG